VFVSSHDIDEVERLADWIGVINDGRLYLAEPVASLIGRFRQVEATFEGDAVLPRPLPDHWLAAEAAGHTLRVVDAKAGEPGAENRVRDVLRGATRLDVSPMPLKAIFMALARTFRSGGAADRAEAAGVRPVEERRR
jgi:ABC-2 type transport system ATP-binding protein